MASAQQPTTKRHISQDDVCSSDPAELEADLKKQKLDPSSEVDDIQPDSTEARHLSGGSTEDSELSEVDLEDPSDGDSDDLDGLKDPVNADGEDGDESPSGDPVEGDDETTGDGDDSEEELPIIEGTEVELVQQTSDPPVDGADNSTCYLLKGKGGKNLKLAISENAISEIHTECLELFESGRLPRIEASDVDIISTSPGELTVHASTVSVSTSYPVRKYTEEELSSLGASGELDTHLLAVERDWCLIAVSGYDTLFGSKDLMPED